VARAVPRLTPDGAYGRRAAGLRRVRRAIAELVSASGDGILFAQVAARRDPAKRRPRSTAMARSRTPADDRPGQRTPATPRCRQSGRSTRSVRYPNGG
jgi:hypothetical protein